MTRLVAFGCSSTYGQGLPDCPTGNEPPSQYVWPSLIAKLLNLECVNTSTLGAPNKKILLQVLDFEFHKDDLVIILWSFLHRGYVFDDDKCGHPVLIADDSSRAFFKVHGTYDMWLDTVLYMHHVHSYLTSLGIKNHQFYFDIRINAHTGTIPISAKFIDFYHFALDRALDKIHVGLRTQSKIAQLMIEQMRVDEKN